MTATLTSMPTATPCRTSVSGAQLDLLVLASHPTGCYGVDLDSGALVRAEYPEPTPASFDLFDVAGAELVQGDGPPDPVTPERVELASVPEVIGRMSPRRAERLLRPLLHPKGAPLLGFAG